MIVVRILAASIVSAPLLAAPRAVVFAVSGSVPGTPLEEMTDAWRETAAKVGGFEWVAFSKTLAQIQAEPGCAKFGPACRGRIAKEIGAQVLFFAKHHPWGGAFEQVDVATGTTTRKARIGFEAEGEELTAKFRDAGVAFVTGGVAELPAAAAAAPAPAPVPAPVALPAPKAVAVPVAKPASSPAPGPGPGAPAAVPAAPTPTTPNPSPAGAQRAVVFGMFGNVPGAPVQQMTDAWREAVAKVAGYSWVPMRQPLAEIQAAPDCAKLGPACRGRVARELGANVLFFAKHLEWGGAFEQVDVATGTTTRKGRIAFEGRGQALINGGRDAGLKFVTDGAPAQAVAVAAPVTPPMAPTPKTAPASVPTVATGGNPPVEKPAVENPPVQPPSPRQPAAQVTDAELERKPRPPSLRTEALAPAAPSALARVRVRTWAAAGGAFALLASGAVFGALSRSALNDLDDPTRGCETAAQVSVCKELKRKAQRRALIANVLFAAGGAAAIGTGALLYLDLSADHVGATATVRF